MRDGANAMTEELTTLKSQLESAFFKYAHITGAVELYMTVLENRDLQLAISAVMSGSATEWKEIHRYMDVEGQRVTWYPEMPVSAIIAQKYMLLGSLYGVALTSMIGGLDFYLTSMLSGHFRCVETSGSSWDRSIQRTNIDLLNRRHGAAVYTLLQERHKIEHNQGRVDRTFLARMTDRKIGHAYAEGDSIQKSHIDVLMARQAIGEFAEDVDEKIESLLTN